MANSFGVSEKTVRDIWSGRTWLRETQQADTDIMSEEQADATASHRVDVPWSEPIGLATPFHDFEIAPNDERFRQPTIMRPLTQLPRSHTDLSNDRLLGPGPHPQPPRAGLGLDAYTLSESSDSAVRFPGAAHGPWTPVPPDSDRYPPPLQHHGLPTLTPGRLEAAEPLPPPSRADSDSHIPPSPPPWQLWRPAASVEAAEPLPPPSRADDPFHDDWPHWGPDRGFRG